MKKEVRMIRKQEQKLESYVEGLEQQIDRLQDHDTFLVNENNALKDKQEKIHKYVMGLERDVEAICGYLEKEQNKQ